MTQPRVLLQAPLGVSDTTTLSYPKLSPLMPKPFLLHKRLPTRFANISTIPGDPVATSLSSVQAHYFFHDV